MFIKEKQTRIKIVLIISILLFLVITIRIFYLQLFNNKLSNLANNLWQRNLPVTASRGEILDRNGKILATNITTTTIYVVPNQIKYKENVAIKLAEILNCDKESRFSFPLILNAKSNPCGNNSGGQASFVSDVKSSFFSRILQARLVSVVILIFFTVESSFCNEFTDTMDIG